MSSKANLSSHCCVESLNWTRWIDADKKSQQFFSGKYVRLRRSFSLDFVTGNPFLSGARAEFLKNRAANGRQEVAWNTVVVLEQRREEVSYAHRI